MIKGKVLLKGLPVPAGSHLRFEDEEGVGAAAVESPSNNKTLLRGVQQHTGSHVRFE